MELKPVRSYRKPAYPEEHEIDKELLNQRVPASWTHKALVTAAFLAFFSSTWPALADSDKNAEHPSISLEHQDRAPGMVTPDWVLAAAAQGALVAPVFIHGGGTGGSGGVAASPLTSLTEDEARSIIESEFRKAGIVFDRHKYGIRGASVEGNERGKAKSIPLTADGFDTKHRLAYEYVPGNDYMMMCEECHGTRVTVNYPQFAEKVRQAFLKAGNVNAAVFYDPMAHSDYGSFPEGSRISAAKSLLREQVRDCIKWARQNGIVK